jgi:hypothetical protein
MSDILAEAYQKGRADLLAELRAQTLKWFHPADDSSEDACLECAESILEDGDHSTVYEVLERGVIKHHFVVKMSELNDGYWENRDFDTREEAEAWIAQRQLELDAQDD